MSDADILARAFQDVERLEDDTRRVARGRAPEVVEAPAPPPVLEATASHFDESLDRRQRLKMTRGEMAIDQRVDLHGLDRQTARRRVANALLTPRRLLLIITGRGKESGGVLRRQLPSWLATNRRVLAWCPAQRRDGGEGATYVLLRRSGQRV